MSDLKDDLMQLDEGTLWEKFGEYWNKEQIVDELLEADSECALIGFMEDEL